jgi:hypothetical protein
MRINQRRSRDPRVWKYQAISRSHPRNQTGSASNLSSAKQSSDSAAQEREQNVNHRVKPDDDACLLASRLPSGTRHRLQTLEGQTLGILHAGEIKPADEGCDLLAVAIGQRYHGIDGNSLGVHGLSHAVRD